MEKKTTSITLIVTQGDVDRVALRQSRGAEASPVGVLSVSVSFGHMLSKNKKKGKQRGNEGGRKKERRDPHRHTQSKKEEEPRALNH